ncbi:all-trans-retinol 13,14-reductase [Nitrosomonas sp. Nm84]|uniref:phytoene desaturase family protein n=1 Tax=Nitrosomonas sp. Nm84 TaxID=200124 RepID=UPI000D760F93|nr:NAD(P)/FAD-dependent oxidoreductase [Nitrosomonas sp. Nm84]PXW83466.1 all-trans-retinol 13,14-reductase [Nitrosomonas sp. Nm84]
MKQVGISYKQHKLDENYDCIVIGSGIGGLTVAALLSRHGNKKVLVLEKHSVAGGFTHVFHRSNYEWDVGVHYIGRTSDPTMEVRAAFDYLTHGELLWSKMPDVYDRIFIGNQVFDFPTGTESFRQQMCSYFPSETRAIDKYIRAVHSAQKLSSLYFAEKAIPSPIASCIGGLLRYGFLRYAKKTTSQAIAEYTSNPELAAVLTGQWGDYGLPPGQSSFGMHSIVAHHYFEGAGYPIGGASRMAESIASTIEKGGGCIAISAYVEEILVDQNKTAFGVKMKDGREIRAKTIISDAGAINTYHNLLPSGVTQSMPEKKLLGAIPPSFCHIGLYVGLKHLPEIANYGDSNLWIYPDSNHDLNFARSCENIDAPFPFLYISFPSSKDPSFLSRYPGRATIEVITLTSFKHFEKWKNLRWQHRGEEYEAFKNRLSKRLLEELERHVPAIKGNIDYWELSTPLSTKHFANYPTGEIYGLAHTPERFNARWLGARTPIKNLLLTGQDVAACGIAGALFGGVVAASNVLKKDMMAVVARGNH